MSYTIKDATIQNSGVDVPLQPKINFTGSGVAVTDGPGSKTTVTITGATPQVFANAYFVDAVYGNNTGAVVGSMIDSTTNPSAHKYKTITAAKNAATPGSIIIVYPGTYSENDLFKNGITYYFYPGCIVTGKFELVANETCKVYGSATFNWSTGAVNARTIGSTFYMECYDIHTTQNAINFSNGNIEIHAHDIITDLQACINIGDSDLEFGRLVVTANIIQNNGPFNGPNPTINNVTSYDGCDADITITANRIIGSSNSFSEVMHFDNYIVPNNRTIMRIKANTIESTTASPAMIRVEYNNNTKIFIEGDIIMPTTDTVLVLSTGGPNSGTDLTYTGSITSGGTMVVLGGSDEVINLNGTFTLINPPV